MPRLNAANNARTMLTQAIDAAVTSFTVADASIFPVPPFRITIDNEIMEVGAKDNHTNTFSSVLRGQEGTTAASHANDAVVENRLTAETYGELATQASLDAHLAETLQQGVHSIATTADITLYVDATNGNDNNPGTDTQPLKTIQAAINKIPQIVNHTVTINVAAGTYDENVTIHGFVGKGGINLLGGTDLASSADYVITGRMSIYSCSCLVYIRGFKFTGAILSDAVYGFIETRRCIHTEIFYCTLDGSNVSFAYERGVVTFYAKTRITGSSISNMAGTSQGVAIYATNLSEIYSDSNEGSDNSIALYASAGIIRKYGTQPSGTTQETTSAGGQIL